MRALPPSRIVILSGGKRSMCEKPQPEQVGTEPKDLTPRMLDDSFPRIVGVTGDLNATSGHRPNKKSGEAATRALNLEP